MIIYLYLTILITISIITGIITTIIDKRKKKTSSIHAVEFPKKILSNKKNSSYQSPKIVSPQVIVSNMQLTKKIEKVDIPEEEPQKVFFEEPVIFAVIDEDNF